MSPIRTQPPIPRPTRKPTDAISLNLPNLPDPLHGKSVLHLSDLHIRRFSPFFRSLIDKCARLQPDIVFLTGDYMTAPGDEKNTLKVLGNLFEALNPTIPDAVFATFGNHDYPLFRRLAPRNFPQINWITNGAILLPDLQTTLLGTSTPCDITDAIIQAQRLETKHGLNPDDPDPGQSSHYRILLGHEPSILVTAAQLNIEWTLAGHTHGGQIRLAPRIALHTSCDLPPRFASGILRMRNSICTVSRGLGGSYFDARLFCRPQKPMYTLQRGPLPGDQQTNYHQIQCVHWW